MLETHISWVVLAGAYAYKIKKAVNLGFCDFATLEKRRTACEEELRLNRRLAPRLYIDVVEIRGTPEAPRIDGPGPVLEYAVRMHRFPQEALASRMLAEGRLTRELMDALALDVARFHAALPSAPPESAFGTAASALHDACENFDQIEALLPYAREDDTLVALRDWCEREFNLQRGHIEARRAAGMIRECHGDLHLGNIVSIDGALVPFDCIEFNPRLRWIDVMSEVAFLFMDLMDRGADALAWRFLNAYLEADGAYRALAVLRFYIVYRAMVRAKVHLIRALQENAASAERSRLIKQYRVVSGARPALHETRPPGDPADAWFLGLRQEHRRSGTGTGAARRKDPLGRGAQTIARPRATGAHRIARPSRSLRRRRDAYHLFATRRGGAGSRRIGLHRDRRRGVSQARGS